MVKKLWKPKSVKTDYSQSSDSGVELDKNKDSDSIITVIE